MTRSPAFQPLTPGPTSLMTPASSLPGEKGSGGLNWYLFWMMRTSGKLTLAALTDTTTSPGPGVGEGSSSSTSDSGGPYALQTMAFMRRPSCPVDQAAVDREGAAARVRGLV